MGENHSTRVSHPQCVKMCSTHKIKMEVYGPCMYGPIWACDTSLEPSRQIKNKDGKKSRFARTALPYRAKICPGHYISDLKTWIFNIKVNYLYLAIRNFLMKRGGQTDEQMILRYCRILYNFHLFSFVCLVPLFH